VKIGAAVSGVPGVASGALAVARSGLGGAGAAVADRQLLVRLATETGVQTAPHAPSFREYLVVLGRHVVRKLLGWIHLPSIDLPGAAPYLEIVARLLAWLLVAGALVLMVRIVVGTYRRRRAREGPEPMGPEATPLEAARPSNAAYWWSRLQDATEAGDTAAALESLWFFTGFRLAGTSLDPSWTSTELLERTGRRDLAGFMTRLDAWRFGPDPPWLPEIESLAGRLREALP